MSALEETPLAAAPDGTFDEEFPELFEGPEKTLTVCFRQRRIAGHSLRLVSREAWSEICKHAKCEILNVVESCPPVLVSKAKDKVAHSKGITAYLLSESSLFVTDNSVVLKTCGRTTPLRALEPILDLAFPNWRNKDPEHYLKYVSFTRLGYLRPDEQLEPHLSWEQEVQYMDRHFKGESTVLGSEATSCQHVYVANYLPKDEIIDTISTQVVLTDLNTNESMRRYGKAEYRNGGDSQPFADSWSDLHGNEKRHPAARPVLDECFFEPIGYSANGVFGKHFTTVHITPQPGCSYLSMETSLPLTREARQRFAEGTLGWCKSDTAAVTEFSLSPKLLAGTAPQLPGFDLVRSNTTTGSHFACAHHHYRSCVKGSLPPRMPPAGSAVDVDVGPQLVITSKERGSRAAAVLAAERELARSSGELDLPSVLLDVSVLKSRADLWSRLLPRVEPFYAVKCNPSPLIVKELWRLWQEQRRGGFDCASAAEMELVCGLEGMNMSEQVIYANPCKQASGIAFAKSVGLNMMTFDNAAELHKIKAQFPSARLVLRVQTDDSKAQCPLSNKFGCAPQDCAALLRLARELALEVVGVSFHVGSGCSQLGAFRSALRRARGVFDEAEKQGLKLTLLDIGGGFPGWDEEGHATFAEHAADICALLEELFPDPALRVIAEPGRFLVAASQALLTTVVSVATSEKGSRYYLNDGLYGSFNCLVFDHATVPRPTILRDGLELTADKAGPATACTLFGPTCDGFDTITDAMELPALRVGDRLLFPRMGAYTTAASTSFNGFAPAECVAYRSEA